MTLPAHPEPPSDPLLADHGVFVFERGWLSSNNVLLVDDARATVIDTGYATHADQTVSLIRNALGGRSLDRIVNTHLHSDHCGGNAALKTAWPMAQIAIPPGQWAAVQNWDAVALTYEPTGQQCPTFRADAVIHPGDVLEVGRLCWKALAAPGHDPHSLIWFEPQLKALISADALWNNGFGVVFPELDGDSGFAEVQQTLEVIASLSPEIVIPGHGGVIRGRAEVSSALERAHRRLAQFLGDPARHRRHALKVLVKFKLLEWQSCQRQTLHDWFAASDYFARIARVDDPAPLDIQLDTLVEELVRQQALTVEGDQIFNR